MKKFQNLAVILFGLQRTQAKKTQSNGILHYKISISSHKDVNILFILSFKIMFDVSYEQEDALRNDPL